MEFDDVRGKKIFHGKYLALAVIAFTGINAYLLIYKPLFQEPEKYKKMQRINRTGIDQSKIQPGDMKIWSSPYEPPTK